MITAFSAAGRCSHGHAWTVVAYGEVCQPMLTHSSDGNETNLEAPFNIQIRGRIRKFVLVTLAASHGDTRGSGPARQHVTERDKTRTGKPARRHTPPQTLDTNTATQSTKLHSARATKE